MPFPIVPGDSDRVGNSVGAMGLELELAYRSLLSTDKRCRTIICIKRPKGLFGIAPLQVAKAYPAAPEIYRFLSALNHQIQSMY
jgi:hypothetical protein